jgi:hypothetical protein
MVYWSFFVSNKPISDMCILIGELGWESTIMWSEMHRWHRWCPVRKLHRWEIEKLSDWSQQSWRRSGVDHHSLTWRGWVAGCRWSSGQKKRLCSQTKRWSNFTGRGGWAGIKRRVYHLSYDMQKRQRWVVGVLIVSAKGNQSVLREESEREVRVRGTTIRAWGTVERGSPPKVFRSACTRDGERRSDAH